MMLDTVDEKKKGVHTATVDEKKKGVHTRYLILLIIFIVTAVNYADRATLSIAGTEVAKELQCIAGTEVAKELQLSAVSIKSCS